MLFPTHRWQSQDTTPKNMIRSKVARAVLRASTFRVSTRRNLRLLNGIVKAIVVLNGIDALLTLFWVRAGLAQEANAFLRTLVDNHAVFFVGAKITLVSLGSLLLWRYRRHPLAVVGLFVVFLVYYIILLHHLRFLPLLAGYLTPE
jgi:hypothetical protein